MEQTKAMSSSKKFTIAIVAMAIALLAVVGGLIGVWAATSQTVNTSFNVRYSIGTNIAATVTVAEDFNGDSADASFTAVTGNAAQALALALDDVTLTTEKTSVTFTYTFQNDSAVPFRAILTDTSKAANVKITYDGDTDAEITVVSTNEAVLAETPTIYVDVAGKGDVAGKDKVTATITVEVKDVNASTASYISNATNGIVWVLDATQHPDYVAPQA